MHVSHCSFLAAVALATFPPIAIANGAPDAAPSIAWGPCQESWVGRASGVLGERLRCGSLTVPFDHVAPDGREMNIGVIRIRAAKPKQREGAIFFNVGGPGSHPGKLLRSMGEAWSRVALTDPEEGDKRRLAERFDLIAVIPRGLVGSGDFHCEVIAAPAPHAFLPTHLGDENWRLLVNEAQTTVDACTAVPQARYINTEQHTHDMDMVRRVLGDERIHFSGISYGGMVGAWYASLYPSHTGRLLLDSSIDLMHGYRAAGHLALDARHRAFNDDVLAPLLRDPARYGLGESADSVTSALDDFPSKAREAWSRRLDTPLRLAAALHIGAWVDAEPDLALESMTRRIEHADFSSDRALNRRIRLEALQLAPALYHSPISNEISIAGDAEGDFVRVAMGCNDIPWLRSDTEIRESARRYAARYFDFNGDETMEEVTCSRWGGPVARRPNLEVLGRAPPFLLIQSEKDTVTPLAGANHILESFTNAHMLVVRRSRLHGVFNFTTSACIERTAARYLLSGAVPAAASRAFTCDEIFHNPVDSMPGQPPSPMVEPTPIDVPVNPTNHQEL